MKFDCFVDYKGYSALSISNFLCYRPSRSVEIANQSTAILEVIKSDCGDAFGFILYDMPVGRNAENKDKFLYSFYLRSFLKRRLEAAGDKKTNDCLTDEISRWQLTDDSYFENLIFPGDEVNRWLTVNIEQYKFLFPLLQGISAQEKRGSELAEILLEKNEIARQKEIIRLQARDEYEAAKLKDAPEKLKPLILDSSADSEVGKPANVSHTTTPTRRDSLTPAIEHAQAQCKDPKDTAAVWAALQSMAEQKHPPLIGATEDGLQYLKKGNGAIFNRDALRKRLAR